jgi:hypothetical protein
MRVTKDKEREQRIAMEIMVDAGDAEERALGWYYYLQEEKLQFPFKARRTAESPISPLRIGEEVVVVGMPSEEECENDMLVNIEWQEQTLSIPLSQVEGTGVDDETQEAIADWRYWVQRGYEF